MNKVLEQTIVRIYKSTSLMHEKTINHARFNRLTGVENYISNIDTYVGQNTDLAEVNFLIDILCMQIMCEGIENAA